MQNINNEQDWKGEFKYQKETISHLSQKNNIDKVLASDNHKYNLEKSKLLGYMKEEVMYEYKFDELDLPDTYTQLKRDMDNPNIDKAIINAILYPEAMDRVIDKAKESNIPFSIVQAPEFTGDTALVLTKKVKQET